MKNTVPFMKLAALMAMSTAAASQTAYASEPNKFYKFTNKFEYQLDAGHSKIEHAWRGPSNVGTFRPALNSAGLTAWYKKLIWGGRLGVRFAHGASNKAVGDGRYTDIMLDLKSVTSFEVMYRRYIYKRVYAFVGFGTYIMPMPHYKISDTNYYIEDSDDDEGYFMGLGYQFNPKVGLEYRFTQYSRIQGSVYDEWTRSHGLHLTYRF